VKNARQATGRPPASEPRDHVRPVYRATLASEQPSRKSQAQPPAVPAAQDRRETDLKTRERGGLHLKFALDLASCATPSDRRCELITHFGIAQGPIEIAARALGILVPAQHPASDQSRISVGG
jgi:hypothetical protein